ncbi:MAG TPA: YajQ family cyclic di-GMP-binding protein, partial [Gammaproteobacteria bacterium]|nr:YajQ family cyclic di-GMP-binding protein [Gammaproteobacteria bacterium]
MPTFDIVSELNMHEVDNAVDQAKREVTNRFDFKGTKCAFEQDKDVITLVGDADFHLRQLLDILENKLIKRGI